MKIKIQKGRPNNSVVLEKLVSPKKLGPTLLVSENLRKLKKLLLIHVECMEIFMELNNEDFHSSKLSKSKY